MTLPPHIPAGASAAVACERLETAGWRLVGAGDWAWAYADPEDRFAARVTPFDPGYRVFAQACLDGPANRWLPCVEAITPLVRDGYVVRMERLWPADEAAASAFCAALGIPNDTGYDAPRAGPAVSADEADIVALRERLHALLAEGKARHPFWLCDIREGNVMADRGGDLKLVDPMGVAGFKICAALEADDANLLADFSIAQLTDFLTIPYFGPGREGLADRDRLLGLVAALAEARSASP
jgi:hypothetical protein